MHFDNRSFLIILILTLLSGCIGKNKIAITLKNSKQVEKLNVTVSNVQVVNHQIIISGTNLNSVSQFEIREGTSSANLQIESKSNTSIIANTVSNVTFAAGKIFDFILSDASAAATFTVNFSLCDSTLGGMGFNCSLAPNDKEVLSFDAASGKWKPRSVNGLSYRGTWDATGASPAATTVGDYYIVSVAGSGYLVGDWTVYRGAGVFDRINNSTVITNVFGRTGAVTANENDYILTKMGDVDLTTNAPDPGDVLQFDGANWVPGVMSVGGGGTVTNVTVTAPLLVSNGSTTPALSIPAATTATNGYLTSTDWNTFNNKQATIAAGAGGVLDYYRGDKTFQTLNTTAVAEGLNLYYTNARVLGLAITGFDNTLAGQIAATDNIVQAFGKTQKQINVLTAGGSAYVATAGGSTMAGTTTLSGVVDATVSGDIHVGSPLGATSAISKAYADAADLLKLNLTGGNLTGAVQMNAQNEVRFGDSDSSNYVGLKSPATVAANKVWTLPAADGTASQVLTTDGAGILSWSTVAGGGAPTGAAGGELAGTYPNPTIAANAITDSHIANAAISQTKINGLATSLAGKEPTIATGTTAQYIRGDKTLSTFANDIWGTVLTGVSFLTSTAITATDSVLVSFGKLQAQITTMDAVDSNKLNKNSADSITAIVTVSGAGDLIVPSTPAGMTSAVNKTYADGKLALTGGNMTGAVQMNAENEMRFADSDSSNYVGLKSPATVAANKVWTLPATDGSSDQVLKTDGAGVLGWATALSSQWITSGSDIYYNAGSVGIGTTTPAFSVGYGSNPRVLGIAGDGGPSPASAGFLHLANNRATSASGDILGGIKFISQNVGTNVVQAEVGSINEGAGGVPNGFGGILFFSTKANNGLSTERLRIDSSGNVGVGTSSPASTLDVSPTLSPSGAFYNQNIGGTLSPSVNVANIGSLKTITSFSPPAGVTVTNASGLRSIIKTGSTGGSILNSYSMLAGIPSYGSVVPSTVYGLKIENQGTAGITTNIGLYVATPTGATNNYAAIFEDGNVGIGTSSPGAPLDVKGAIRLSGSASGFTGFAPAAAAGSTVWTLPAADGTANQVLKTDGAGILSWAAPSSGPANTDALTEGSTNLYYTNTRGISSTITAPTLTNSAIATSDTIQVALGKLQAQFNNVINAVLTGISTATSSAITAADSIVVAFGKLQAQITTMDAVDSNKLNKNSADSITAIVTVSGAGDLIVPSTPAGMTSAVNKTYADGKLALTGGSMTGAVQMNAQNEVRFADSDSSNYVGLRAPATVAANLTWTLPASDGTSGQVLSTNGSGTLAWATAATSSSWTIETAGFTAVAGGKYFVDTTSAALTLTLPAAATLGDTIAIIDVAGTFATNNLTVGANGLKVMALAQDMTVDTANISLELVYSNATYGWRVK